MKRIRRRAGERVERVVNLTDRDLDIMTLVGLVRYATKEQIAREFFGSTARAAARTLDLFDGGYLNVTLVGSRQPKLLSLSNAGQKVVKTERPELADRLHRAGPIQMTAVRHHLASVDARLWIANLARTRGEALAELLVGAAVPLMLLYWANPGDAKIRDIGLSTFKLTPDGLAILDVDQQELRLAVEVDCGTETSRILKAKNTRYERAIGTGAITELWWVVDAGPRRVQTIANLADKGRLGSTVRVLPLAVANIRPTRLPPPCVDEHDRDPSPGIERSTDDPTDPPSPDLDGPSSRPTPIAPRPDAEKGSRNHEVRPMRPGFATRVATRPARFERSDEVGPPRNGSATRQGSRRG